MVRATRAHTASGLDGIDAELCYQCRVSYYEDLSAYEYQEIDVIRLDWGRLRFRPGYDRINVGWLDTPHAFTQGATPSTVLDALWEIVAGSDINVMRGFHRCSFCPRGSTDSMIWTGPGSGPVVLGHKEIRVPSLGNVMFAAPALIVHYVDTHSYRPPDEFIEAVLRYDHRWIEEPSPWIPADAQRLTFD